MRQAKQAVLKTLAPEKTGYHSAAICEAFSEIGDGLPTLRVDGRFGREPERRKALLDVIAVVTNTEPETGRQDTRVLFGETLAPGH